MDVDLRPDDLVGTYSGLRPLIAPSDGTTVTASREHRVVAEENGLIRVSGGKFTTYRVMARDAIDAGDSGTGRGPPLPTEHDRRAPLVGAADPPSSTRSPPRSPRSTASLARSPTVSSVATDATPPRSPALGAKEQLLRTLGPGVDHLEVEVAWAARHEHALSLDDVLARRMRLAQELPDRGAAIAVAWRPILGDELGWDASGSQRRR